MDVELADIPVHSLVPEPLREVASVDDFMARLPEFDGDIAGQLADAEAAGECLRFVGAFTQLLWGMMGHAADVMSAVSFQAQQRFIKRTWHSHTLSYSFISCQSPFQL